MQVFLMTVLTYALGYGLGYIQGRRDSRKG